MLGGLTNVNVELTSRCNKSCHMCGRRERERLNPEVLQSYGDMDFSKVEEIAAQLPPGIVVQLHNNGESMLYPRFGEAVSLFSNQITNVVTNGRHLLRKFDEIVGRLSTMAVSIVEDDPEGEEQYEILAEFLDLKGGRSPHTIARLNGDVHAGPYEDLGLPIARRLLHAPGGSYDYSAPPTVPEIGVCLDFLGHLSIDRYGRVSQCVRYDPDGLGVIGYLGIGMTLDEIWNSEERMSRMRCHLEGRRADVPLCSGCHFWGVPTGRI